MERAGERASTPVSPSNLWHYYAGYFGFLLLLNTYFIVFSPDVRTYLPLRVQFITTVSVLMRTTVRSVDKFKANHDTKSVNSLTTTNTVLRLLKFLLSEKLEKHKLSYSLSVWAAFMNFFKFVSGFIFISNDELFIGTGYYFSVFCVFMSILLTMQNFRILLSSYNILRHKRHNKLVIDYVDLMEEAFANEDEPVDLMFRFRCSTFMRFFVKMLLIMFCVTYSYMIFEMITSTLRDFLFKETVSLLIAESFILVIILILLCIPDVLCYITYIALVGNILFLLSLAMAFKCPSDYQFGIDPMQDLWNYKIWPMPVFVIPLLTQASAFIIPLRFEMERSNYLSNPPYMIDLCLWILGLILCVVSYVFYGLYADNFKRFPLNCLERKGPYGVIVVAIYALNELCTIPLYVHILANTMYKYRFERRAAFIIKNFKRSGFLIAFIFFGLTPQAIAFSSYLANISSTILTIILPPILEWRIFCAHKFFACKMQYIRIYLTLIIGLIIMACSLYDIPTKEKISAIAYERHYIYQEKDVDGQNKFVIFME
uniref:Amino acid transporter transmembrane domain-containing protein n=1 Tax=Glossina brevipalpis TaxID=37001 RepID=A0A1A9WVF6_9MUSC